MNKKYILILGFAAGLISIYFLNELFKGIVILLLSSNEVEFTFSGIIFKAVFTAETGKSFLYYLFIFNATVLASIIFIELTALLFKKYMDGMTRTQIIIFQLINIGYLLFHLFYGVFTVAFSSSLESSEK